MTRICNNVLGTIKLRGPNVRLFYGESVPFLGRFSAEVIMGIYNRSLSRCLSIMGHLTSRPVSVVRVGVSYPGIGRNKVTFKASPGNIRAVADRVGGCTGRPIVVGLSPGIADVTRVTETTRTNKTSTISLVGAVANVGVSVGEEDFILTGGANNVDNPTIRPITIHVICRATRTIGVPVVKVNNVAGTASTVRVVLTKTATISINATGFMGPGAARRVISNVTRCVSECKMGSVSRLINTISE